MSQNAPPSRRPELPTGFTLIDFLLARANETGEPPPREALDWQDVEILALRQWGRTDRAALEFASALTKRSYELADECRGLAQRWATHPDFDAGWSSG